MYFVKGYCQMINHTNTNDSEIINEDLIPNEKLALVRGNLVDTFLDAMHENDRKSFTKRLKMHIVRFGDGRNSYTKELVAAHEAGHALIAHILGLSPSGSRISKDINSDVWRGFTCQDCMGEFKAGRNQPKSVAMAMCLLSGWLAEGIVGGVVDNNSLTEEKLLAFDIINRVSEVTETTFVSLCSVIYRRTLLLIEQNILVAKNIQKHLYCYGSIDQKQLNIFLNNIPVESYNSLSLKLIKESK
jgi:DNA-binding ferritin-like protein (Dps family)